MKVFSGQVLLYSRDIPWDMVDPVIKREFMIAYMENKLPHTMVPIW